MQIQFQIGKEKVLLRSSESCFELCRLRQRTDKESGEVLNEWIAEKYFASLEQGLSKLLDLKVKASEATTLQQLRKDLDKARAEIMNAWSTGIKAEVSQ